MYGSAIQIIAINLGAFAVGIMYGSGAYQKHKILFASNVILNVVNVVFAIRAT